jgi:hypothetical protein
MKKSWIKNFIPSLAILALLGMGMMIFSLTKPSVLYENRLENTIHIKTNYQLVESVSPNLLFPQGTTLNPDKTMTTALANSFNIKETVEVTSDKPVEINATSEPILKIENEGTWEKTYPIGDKKTFNNKGLDSSFTIEMAIPAKELFTYLDQVEKKLNLHAEQYVFHVNPQLKGTVSYQGIKLNLDGKDGLDFDHNQNELTLQNNEKLTYTKSYPIKTMTNRQNQLTFMSLAIPVKSARIFFTIMFILFTLLWLFAIKHNKQHQPEYMVIDRKYAKHLVRVTKLLEIENNAQLELSTFKDLLLVSDEKEMPICRYENEHEVIYFVPDHQFVYNFKLPIEGRSRKR